MIFSGKSEIREGLHPYRPKSWRVAGVLDCGGKSDATPLSLVQDGLMNQERPTLFKSAVAAHTGGIHA